MPLTLPSSLSPSKVSTFKDCALAFRYSAIDKLPEPPSVAAVKGTLVHRSLELLFGVKPAQRNASMLAECFDDAARELRDDEEFNALGLDEPAQDHFFADASEMSRRYLDLEDPTTFDPIGVELMLTTELRGVTLRGIIDRLDRLPNGDLIVTDYKTGRVPSVQQEMGRLGGVHFYAMLCEKVLGQRPISVQLMYLGKNPQIISTAPTEQSVRGVERKLDAIWQAVERACEREDFRPKPSALCSWCSFKAFCPSFGGSVESPNPDHLAI